MQVDHLQRFPVQLAQPIETLSRYFVVADVELLQIGPFLVGESKRPLVAHVTVTEVKFLQIAPIVVFHQIFDALVVEQVATEMQRNQFRPFVVSNMGDSLRAEAIVAEPQRLQTVPAVTDQILNVLVSEVALVCIKYSLLSDNTFRFCH